MKRLNLAMAAGIALLLSLPGCCWKRSDCNSCEAPRKERSCKSCKSCPMDNDGMSNKRMKKMNHGRYKQAEEMNGEEMMSNSVEVELE